MIINPRQRKNISYNDVAEHIQLIQIIKVEVPFL